MVSSRVVTCNAHILYIHDSNYINQVEGGSVVDIEWQLNVQSPE